MEELRGWKDSEEYEEGTASWSWGLARRTKLALGGRDNTTQPEPLLGSKALALLPHSRPFFRVSGPPVDEVTPSAMVSTLRRKDHSLLILHMSYLQALVDICIAFEEVAGGDRK